MSTMSFDAETSFPRQNARCEQLVANHSAGKMRKRQLQGSIACTGMYYEIQM